MIGAVLAGGRSERMGRDKAALLLADARGGEFVGASPREPGRAITIEDPQLTWLERAILLLAERFPEPWIVGRRVERGDSALPNLSAFPEQFPPLRSRGDLRAGAGPLGGLETALELAAGDAALMIPCDLPRLDLRALDLLLEARGSASALAFRSASGRKEPAVALVESEVLPALRRYLDEGSRAAHRFLELVQIRWLDLPSALEEGFRNLNTPEDLARPRTLPGN